MWRNLGNLKIDGIDMGHIVNPDKDNGKYQTTLMKKVFDKINTVFRGREGHARIVDWLAKWKRKAWELLR